MSFLTRRLSDLVATESDINEHLVTLFLLASQCDTIVEFGVRDGFSTTAFMASRPKSLKSYDIDIKPDTANLFELAKEEGVNCELIKGDSREVKIDPVDLIFIDTDHTYECLSAELALHGNSANMFLVFHDTESFRDRLMPAIDEFTANNHHWGVFKEYTNNNGLLILNRRN